MIQQKQAFTLIELLIVVLIIGILASVAVPKYRNIVDKARLVKWVPLLDTLEKAQRGISWLMVNMRPI